MGSKTTSTAVFFLATMAGVCVVMGGFLYRDKDLRRRVRSQANDMLDISEQALSLTKKLVSSFMGEDSSLDQRIIELDDEWTEVYETRGDA